MHEEVHCRPATNSPLASEPRLFAFPYHPALHMSLWTTQNAFHSFRKWFLPAGLRLPKTSLSSEQAVLFRYDRRLPEKRAYAGWLASAGFMCVVGSTCRVKVF
jgi:hypothetical protein